MTNEQFIQWAENFFVDVEWTPAIKNRLNYMINQLDERIQVVEKPVVLIKKVTKYITPGDIDFVDKPELDDIAISWCNRLKVTLEALVSKRRERELVTARQEFSRDARINHGYTLNAIARYLNRDHTTVIHYMRHRKPDMIPIDETKFRLEPEECI